MEEVITSAPAKVILFGEHLVVHGATALTTALDLRTFCRITPSSESNPSVHIKLPDIQTDTKISLSSLIFDGKIDAWNEPPRSVEASLMTFLETCAQGNRGVVAVLFLILSIAGDKIKDFQSFSIDVTSEFQPGVGLGSSGAFNVALSAALLRFFDRIPCSTQTHPHVNTAARGWTDTTVPHKDHADLINKWAYAAETIMHGQPSGIDNSISTYGGAVSFKSGQITVIDQVPALKLAITNTKVPRSTKILVGNVGLLRKQFPSVFDPIITSVEQISQTTLKIFSEYVSTSDSEKHEELENQINSLVDVNQGLLCAIGVGHESLDRVVKIGMKQKLHSKLTGAGGGGCAITLLPKGTTTEQIKQLEEDMKNEGFDCFDAKIGAAGILFHKQLPSSN